MPETKDQSRLPNIVFILSDDQGAWAMGCAGNPEIHTPNMDRLAAQGMRFSHFFCASPVCSPARASLLTGKIPSAHGVHDWIRSGNVNRKDLSADLQSNPVFRDEAQPISYLSGQLAYTQILAEQGYDCALSGKWHLGDSLNPQQGFSKWFTLARGGCDYYQPDVVRDGRICLENRYVTDLITEQALAFLKEQAGGTAPFYLSVHYTAPHAPWDREQHLSELYDSYADCPFLSVPEEPIHPWQVNGISYGEGERRRQLLQGYYAAVTAMDQGIGDILDELEQSGEAENTLVIFTSDNGMNMGHHGIWGKGNGTFPQNMYDTSVKVPFLISHPAHIPQGVEQHELLSHYDFLPTLLDYLGMHDQIPSGLPGKSFAPLLKGETVSGDGRVVVADEYGPVRMIRTRNWKYVHRYPYGPHELFDLVADPEERNNLIDDPDQKGRIVSMKQCLDEWFYRYVDPSVDGANEGVTGLGQLRLAGLHGKGQLAYKRTEDE